MKKVNLTKAQIAEISQDLDMSSKCYYRFSTGEIRVFYKNESDYYVESGEDELPEEDEDEEGEERATAYDEVFGDTDEYFEFEPMTSHEFFQVMEDFVETVSDKKLAIRLVYALNNNKPFRRFKDAVEDSSHRQNWFEFRDKSQIARIEKLIARHNNYISDEENSDTEEVEFEIPDPTTVFPLTNYERLCFLKNIIKNPNIIVGDYTYYDDFESVENFEKNVRYHFDFTGDKLTIGKFCMIASGVEFIMNGANHLVDAVSSFPFAVFGGDWAGAMEGKTYPNRGDIVVGNDVWIGYQATIMSGVKIGDGAIIGAKSVVTSDVPPYSIVGGNPARIIRKRHDDATIERLLKLAWWNWDLEKLTRHVGLLTGNDVAALENAE